MNLLIRLIVATLAVIISSWLLPGVHVNGIVTAIIVAIVLGFLNAFVKPVLTFLTIPITIITLGLFLLVINVIIVYITDALIAGFRVDGFLWALIFSFVVSIVGAILSSLFDD
ncbi:phage holin family protein [Cytophagaceae bacterium DM2B3-1]|uniref:Phage holin family protein n=1 Tax=Xanthocytophaga flava TaxID=3048013 RepID=A0ABT7CPE5_9BACT|nr:phage holin family protein [Xanthocytophaga flavus]MDJ1467346.1 phage holin family protein [Xanthocytophaga flavus]MDJ1494857.1 phage holin family protein [Xanthocytophaga flavus]